MGRPAGHWTVRVKRSGRVRGANLDQGALTYIGRLMVQAQKQRWSKGITAEDQAAPKLSKKYLFEKRKKRGVHRPIRDMHLTGETIANFQLRKAVNNIIRAEPTQRETRRRAMRSVSYAAMIGFASSDSRVVFNAAKLKYGQALSKAWIPIG